MPTQETSKIKIVPILIGLALTGATFFTIFYFSSKGWKTGQK